jgi:hypothetical protein
MRNLFLCAIAGAMLLSSTSDASKKSKSKDKDKSFVPVASSDAGGYAGHYVGIESKYWVDVQVDAHNGLAVTLYEDGTRVPVREVKLTGSHLEATKIVGDDSRVPFEATFGENRVNGKGAFGLLVEGEVRIDDDVVLSRLFYRRTSSTPGSAP